MGLKEKFNSNTVFLNCMLGSFVEKVTDETPGAIKRKITKGENEGKEVYEKHYSEVSGYICDMKYRADENFKNWILTLTDDPFDSDSPKYSITFSRDSRECTALLEYIPSVDLNSKIYIIVWEKQGVRKLIIKKKNIDGEMEYVPNFYKEFKNNKFVGYKNKYPAPNNDDGSFDSDDWKSYFIQVRKFLDKSTNAWIEKILNPHLENIASFNNKIDPVPEAPDAPETPEYDENDLPF